MKPSRIKNELQRLALIFPPILLGGVMVGVVLTAFEVFSDGDWTYGLWRTAFTRGARLLNQSLVDAFSLATFLFATTAAQTAAGRPRAAGLRAAIGFLFFYPFFLTVLWLFTAQAINVANLPTAKLPDLLKRNQQFGRYLYDNFVLWLDLTALPTLLVRKAQWFWPSAVVAAMFGVWFDRGAAAMWRLRRAPARPPAERPRRHAVWVAAVLCAVGVVTLIVNMTARAARLTTAEPRPNVILISLDTVRADRLGGYGNPRARTPALDLLAANGVLFEEAISNASWTLPSHGAMLTGVQPTALGLFKVTDRLNPRTLTMAKVFREYGFDTAAMVSYVLLDREYGFDRGFDSFDYVDLQSAKTIVDKAIEFVKPREFRKFFMFLHIYDAHWPYEPTEDTAKEFWPHYIGPDLRDLIDISDYAQFALKVINGPPVYNDYCQTMYDGELHDIDNELGRLFRYLVERKMIDRTLIIVTSDHGEQFLEHGLFGHGLTLYDEELHVPLIMRFPKFLPAGVRVKGQVQSLDIFPTAMALAGLDPARYALAGNDLRPATASGTATPRAMIAETSMSGDPRYALRNGKFKLISPYSLDFGHDLIVQKPEEIFELAVDPKELANLAPEHPKMAEALRLEMAEQMKSIRQKRRGGERLSHSQALSPEEIERLRSLGYIK